VSDDHVTRALAGDEQAFTLLFRDMQPRLVRYLTALVGGDATDVAQDTWAQVFRDLHRFSGDLDGFRGWVTTIGRHRALDHLRASRRRPVQVEVAENLARWAGADAADTALEVSATRAAVELIASLPPDQAEAVLLRAVVGLDAATAAAVLGKRAGAVRTAAYRGLRTLRDRLGEAPAEGRTGESAPLGARRVTSGRPPALEEVT
jgi:RNA polymerase sigma-70 factor (ECF subfamily)